MLPVLLLLFVRRAPAALIVPSERLADLLGVLGPVLGVSREVAADILLQVSVTCVHAEAWCQRNLSWGHSPKFEPIVTQ